MAQQILSTNTFCEAKWVVSATASDGTHTTIQSAITSAASGDTVFIRDGSYTENLTLKVGVNLDTFSGSAQTPTVTIIGTCTLTTAGTVSISNIRLQTNGANLIAVTGSAASILNINNCYLNCTNNTGISFTSSNASAAIIINDSFGNLGTTGIAYHSSTSAGVLSYTKCSLENTGASTTTSSSSAGILNTRLIATANPFGTTGTCGGTHENSRFDMVHAGLNTAGFICNGSVVTTFFCCTVISGTASAITIAAGGLCEITKSKIDSTNANALSGAGTLSHDQISFINTATMNVTTQTLVSPPSVSAYVGTTVTNVTGDSTVYTILFNTVVSDLKTNYVAGTGIFTAPYKSNYIISGCVTNTGLAAGNTLALINIVTTLKTYPLVVNPGVTRTSGNESSYSFSGVFLMNAGDTLHIESVVTGGTKIVGIRQDATFLGIAALS